MSSPSPSDGPEVGRSVGLTMDRPIPMTWCLVGVLGLVHWMTALTLASHGEGALWEAALMSRSPGGRELVGGQVSTLLSGEPWRLASSVLLHADGLHVLVNAGSLWGMGRLLEPWVGPWRLLGWFAAGGLVGSVASAWMGIPRSDGASGAVFALLGAAVLLGRRHREALSPEDRLLYGPVLGVLLVGNLVLSLLLPFVDATSHLGGLITGFLVGAVPLGRWDERSWAVVGLGFLIAGVYGVGW